MVNTRRFVWAMLILSLSVGVHAADISWNGAGGDQLWSNPDNWEGSVLPGESDTAILNSVPGPVVTTKQTVGKVNVTAGGGTGELTIDGGELIAKQDYNFGGNPNAVANVRMYSGLMKDSAGGMNFCWKGDTTFTMFGGRFEMVNPQVANQIDDCKTRINLYGGEISCWIWNPGNGDGVVDITGGTLRTGGRGPDVMQGWVDEGKIIAYGGQGTVHVAPSGGKGSQATASHPLMPIPTDANTIVFGTTEMSWVLPTTETKVDVYVTDDYDKLINFAPEDIDDMLVVDKQNVSTVTIQTEAKKRYYWAIDIYEEGSEDPIYGPIFHFYADNLPPVVDTGADVVTYPNAEGQRVGDLLGSVIDSGTVTRQWSIVSEPDDPNSPKAVIADPAALQTTITMSAVGAYELKLTADDGEYEGSDTMTITVYENNCEAAKALPTYEALVGDLNSDCVVDELDEALMQQNWLKDISLTDEWVTLD